MEHADSPHQEQYPADMNKRWSFLGMDFKKLASWRSHDTHGHYPDSGAGMHSEKQPHSPTCPDKSDRRGSGFGKVVPTFGRVKTLKRQQSELRNRLEPVAPTTDERRAASSDRRMNTSQRRRASEPRGQSARVSTPMLRNEIGAKDPSLHNQQFSIPISVSAITERHDLNDVKRPHAPEQIIPILTIGNTANSLRESEDTIANDPETSSIPNENSHLAPGNMLASTGECFCEEDCHVSEKNATHDGEPEHDNNDNEILEGETARDLDLNESNLEIREDNEHPWDSSEQFPDEESQYEYQKSLTDSEYEKIIQEELEKKWILNLSMHFRDKSKREKFFVTYFQETKLVKAWRRVTISLDYRDAPESSLELDLLQTKYQREKSAKIYESIRESLPDIQFYPTVTNLKLQTTDGRLHVHVVEDVNEIIHYPSQRLVSHLRCRKIRERDINFDSHMSGFVYKVKVNGRILIKKEIPGPDAVDEFLYEINALNQLRDSYNVIEFYGIVVDDYDDKVKGLLISYAEKGALIDIIYDHDHTLPWDLRRKWAHQIVQGLADIHESGFVQGDFTLSNIVIDKNDDAKIIDINRRGCPIGWEPPEATSLIENGQRISLYIGAKSDLFQLGMVLWALATQEDEPESHQRPLHLTVQEAPRWYCRLVEICLSEDPRYRMQASSLLALFPDPNTIVPKHSRRRPASCSVSADDYSAQFLPNNQTYQYVDIDGMHSDIANVAPRITNVSPPGDWPPSSAYRYSDFDPPVHILANEFDYKPMRGRSPPRIPNGVLQDHGVTPQYSWKDREARGWRDSESTTPRSEVSPLPNKKQHQNEGLVQDSGVANVVLVGEKPQTEAGESTVHSTKELVGNTDARENDCAAQPGVTSLCHASSDAQLEIEMQPIDNADVSFEHAVLPRQSEDENTVLSNRAPILELDPSSDELLKGIGTLEGPKASCTVEEVPPSFAALSLSVPPRLPASPQFPSTNNSNEKVNNNPPWTSSSTQNPTAEVLDMRVEAANRSVQDSHKNVPQKTSGPNAHISYKSLKNEGSSVARTIRGASQPQSSTPSPMQPWQMLTSEAGEYTSFSSNPTEAPADTSLLMGVGGSVDILWGDKRNSGMFAELDALVGDSPTFHKEKQHLETRERQETAVEVKT